jgi:hypothetical protein
MIEDIKYSENEHFIFEIYIWWGSHLEIHFFLEDGLSSLMIEKG